MPESSMPRSGLRSLAVILLFLVVSLPAAAQKAVPSMHFGAEGFTLENGLQVVVIPNHRAPVVTQMVWYRTGGADESIGKSGIAHFLEHLMFRGTKTVPPGMFSRLVALNGGRDNAFTAEDYTAYFQTVAVDRLPLVMQLESDRMANLVITDAVVEPERKVILEERRLRIDNNPAALLEEQARRSTYIHHPYGIPTIGWEHEMEQLSTSDAQDWYRRWYAPNNAILVVSGDITAAELKPLAEKYYGAIPAKTLPTRARVEEPPHVAGARLEMKSAQVAQPSWRRAYLAPSYTGGETKHAYALEVLAQILGGSATSRLTRDLVLDQRLALAAGAFYDPGAIDVTTFGLYATPRQDVGVEQLQAAMEKEVARILADGVSAEEVDRAKARMVAQAVYARDSLSGPANIFGAALANGRSIADVEAWPGRIAEISAEAVNDAAKAVLKEGLAVTAVLLPDPNAPARGEAGAPVMGPPGGPLHAAPEAAP
jgi:zinc protease